MATNNTNDETTDETPDRKPVWLDTETHKLLKRVAVANDRTMLGQFRSMLKQEADRLGIEIPQPESATAV